ncbi:energy-coupling factor ABC transporter substrate-binding protein [Butyricicoccus sp.]|uniref:energy-coupling factor ABC transporter substrate-binding protein n=1 Tax=Butyricicoccus sp. TaxID=2049021 RepID=UPI003F1864A5
MKKTIWKKNLVLLLLVAAIAVIPLVFIPGEYGGSDDQATDAIAEQNPDYEPWFSSLYEPPSGEIESLLFCVQTAIGAGVVGFVLGRLTAKKTRNDEESDDK